MIKLPNHKKRDQETISATKGYLFVVVGIALILVGISWKQIVPAKTFWSEEDAVAYAKVAEAAHAATIGDGHDHSHDHGHSHGEVGLAGSAKGLTAREEFELARESLIKAKSAHSRWGQYLSALGAIVAFVGMVIVRRHNG